MSRDYREWLNQAEYDLETADYMIKGGRHFYAVFMCHLAVEKALKGLYQKKSGNLPEKTHNLVFFLEKISINPPDSIGKFIVKLNSASVSTRYPESLAQISSRFTPEITANILAASREVLAWIKQQF